MTTLSTSDVLDRHLNSFAKYDLAGILADYSSDAVLFTPAGPLRGPAEIKPLFQALVSEFAKPGSSFTMQHRSIEGDHARVETTVEGGAAPSARTGVAKLAKAKVFSGRSNPPRGPRTPRERHAAARARRKSLCGKSRMTWSLV